MGVTCPFILAAFVMLAIFFAFPEKRRENFPFLKEYRVKIDFNELQRQRALEKEKQSLVAAKPPTINPPGDTTSLSDDSSTATVDDTQTNPASDPAAQNATDETQSTATRNDNDTYDSSSNTPDYTIEKPDVDLPPPQSPVLNPPLFIPPELPPRKGKPLKFVKATLKGVPFYQATIDLKDPETFLSIQLANNADQANCVDFTHGDEAFNSFVKRSHGAIVQNGTFFSKDNQKRVMGNMVDSGRYLKYSQWENYGTTLGIKKNNEPEMVTARIEGQPDWSQHWFSITCGPRLLTNGEILIDAEKEGFTDSHVLGVGPRCAIGFPATKDKIYLVTFLMGLSLKKEAEVMKAMGCSEAMNLDGGASKALAHNGEITVQANRPLTNVIVVYDTKFPAPKPLIKSWKEFQKRPDQIAVGY